MSTTTARTHHHSGRKVRPTLLTHLEVDGTREHRSVDTAFFGTITVTDVRTVCGLTLRTTSTTGRRDRTDCGECAVMEATQ